MPAYDAVLVSAGSGGGRIARAIAATGRRVALVVPPGSPAVDTLAHPPGPGLLLDPGPSGEAVFGPLLPFTPTHAVQVKGRTHATPASRIGFARMIPGRRHGPAVAAWAAARVRFEVARLVGGGSEQRSYRDWLVGRFGQPAYDALFAAYVGRRFGPAEEVICGLGRLHQEVEAAWAAPAQGWGAVPARLAEGVERVEATVTKVARDRVETSAGPIEAPVYLDAAPSVIAGWLGADAPPPVRDAAERLRARTRVQVVLRGGDSLPLMTHLLDGEAPWWRVLRPGLLPQGEAGVVLVDASLDAGDPLLSLDDAALARAAAEALAAVGLPGFTAADRPARRLPDHDAVWRHTHLTRLRNWILALDELGLTPLGRLGLAARVDPGTEVHLARAVLDEEGPGLRELVRQLVEPPVLDAPGRTRLGPMFRR